MELVKNRIRKIKNPILSLQNIELQSGKKRKRWCLINTRRCCPRLEARRTPDTANAKIIFEVLKDAAAAGGEPGRGR